MGAWINATASAKARATRIGKTISKLDGEHRRPCCFNLSACTDPEVSESGKLIAPRSLSDEPRVVLPGLSG